MKTIEQLNAGKVWAIIRISDNKNVYQCSDKDTAEFEFKRVNKNKRFKLRYESQRRITKPV